MGIISKFKNKKITEKHWGLGAELQVSLVILVFFIMSIAGLVFLRIYQTDLILLQTHQATYSVQILSNLMTQSNIKDENSLKDFEKLIRNYGFNDFVILNQLGKINISTKKYWLNDRNFEALVSQMIVNKETAFLIDEGSFWDLKKTPSIYFMTPFFDSGAYTNETLVLKKEFHGFLILKKKVLSILAAFLFIDVLAAFLFGRLLIARQIAAPVKKLTQAMDDLVVGKYDFTANLPAFSGEFGSLFHSFQLTARKLTESQEQLKENLKTLKNTQNKLIHSEKMATVGRLAAGLAHEMGNPLGAVLGMMYLLKRDDLSQEEKIKFNEQAISELNRMDSLIRSLLDFSRSDKFVISSIKIEPIIEQALNLLKHQKWFENINISLDIDHNLPQIQGDLNLILQVLLNILSNAGQSLFESKKQGQGKINIKAYVEQTKVNIMVTDNGLGVKEEYVERLFEPFFTLKSPGEGTGLGLFICHSIMESFGGTIEFITENIEGASFVLSFNASDESEL